MKTRWRELAQLEDGKSYLVLATSIPARRRTSAPRLFRGSRAVAAQLEHTHGVVGFSMLARPLRKQYATLSVWIDDDALRAFASSAPHTALVTELASDMAPTRFVQWTIKSADGLPSWDNALDRLAH